MPSTNDNGERISGSKYASNRRIVHEFGSYLLAHLMDTPAVAVDPYAIRELVNDIMKQWIDTEYRCDNPNCRYCAMMQPNPTFRRVFLNKLGSKSEIYGYRRKDNENVNH